MSDNIVNNEINTNSEINDEIVNEIDNTSASSVTGGVPISKLKVPSNFGRSVSNASKIGRLCSHALPKAGPPPRDCISMSRENDDNFSSMNSTTTSDLYQETIKRFTRSSLSPEMDGYSANRFSFSSNTARPQNPETNRRRSSNDFYIEATGRRRSSDQGAILTHDTEQFIIGQKVWVGGIRPGQIAYIGETHFAPGEWAGVVLDEPNGKNDGCVAGKRYFQCEPKRGIFSRLTRLTLAPLAGVQISTTSPLQKQSPERSRTGSPTTSLRSSSYLGKSGLTVGDRVIVSSGFGSRPGILRYLGETKFATGNWCGVELDEPTGKNDGSVEGVRYFECKPKYGLFVPIAKVSLSPSSRKSRLSRAGSRESLTSIGTMNSIATTNTSRLRMSSQELLREKQSHIEQLMIERELDREDTQTQALQYQKNINELKARITVLEDQLIEERKKAEELQFSVDEATFCGDELNAQTQVYKEKIQDLENRVKVLTFTNTLKSENSAIQEIENKLLEQIQLNEIRRDQYDNELRNLHDTIEYLRNENDNLRKELRNKDEIAERTSLFEKHIANENNEFGLLKEEYDKEQSKSLNEFNGKLNAKNNVIQQLSKEMISLRSTLSSSENDRSKIAEKCHVLEDECKSSNEKIDKLNKELVTLSSEQRSKQKEYSKCHSEESNKYQNEITILKEDNARLESLNDLLQQNIKTLGKEMSSLRETNLTMTKKIDELNNGDTDKQTKVNNLEKELCILKSDYINLNSINEELKECLKKNTSMYDKEKIAVEQLNAAINEKNSLLSKAALELSSNKNTIEELEANMSKLNETMKVELQAKFDETNILKHQLQEWENKSINLKTESSSVIQQLQTKLTNLENDNKILENNLRQSEDTLQKLREQCCKQENLLTNKETELRLNQTTLESTNKILETLKAEYETSVNNYHQLEQQLKNKEESLSKYKLMVSDLERELETFIAKCDSLQKQNDSLQTDILNARSSSLDMQNLDLSNKMQQEIDEIRSTEALKYQRCMENTEDQLRQSQKHNISLKEGVSSLQQQVHLLQEEMFKSQVAYKAKENELQNQIETLKQEKKQLNEMFIKSKTNNNQSLEHLQRERAELMQRVEKLSKELNETKNVLTQTQNEVEQLLLRESNAKSNSQIELKKYENNLELLNNECEHKNKLLEEDKQKIEELKNTIEVLKTFNQSISKTNADLSSALDNLQQEKCETRNIFELFEMESDQNMSKLLETMTNQKELLNDTLEELSSVKSTLENRNRVLTDISNRLEHTEKDLNECQNQILLKSTEFTELEQLNKNLSARITELEETIKQEKAHHEQQLNEYKTIIDEMDDNLNKKSSNINEIQGKLQQYEQQKAIAENRERELLLEKKTLQRKLEILEMNKSQKIDAVQGCVNNLQSLIIPMHSNHNNGVHGEKENATDISSENSTAHINFLHSIIADMQKKNDTLKAKIESLEAIPTDFTQPHAFDLIGKRKPTPRVFCDICDEFDKHETEDCPLQASDDRDYSPPPTQDKKERKLPEPRKYCENCEIFGHDTAECTDDQCY